MIKPKYTLTNTGVFPPRLEITAVNFDSFSKYLKPDEALQVELKGLSHEQERFTLSALCGYQRFYPKRKIEVKTNGNFHVLKSIPPLKSLYMPRFFLNLQLTSRCNFDCKHCYNQLKNKYLKQTDLPLQTIETVCRQFLSADRARKFENISVYLLGGEPFLHPRLPEIIGILSKLKINKLYFNDVRLGTNGLLVPKNIELLKRARDLFEHFSVQISIDGDEKTYPEIRGHKIDVALRALETLAQNNIKRQIACSVSRLNKFCLEYILELCDKYKASPHINPYTPFNEELEVLTRSEWETFKLYLTGMLDRWYMGACGYSWGCGMGWNGTCVDPEGYIIGCPRDPEIFGHIDNIGLDNKKVWRTEAEGPFLFYNRCGRFIKNDITERRASIDFPLEADKTPPPLQLIRKEIASNNIYYCREDKGLAYGPDLKLILRQIPETRPDPIGIYNFLTFGYLPFEHTLIKDLYKLEMGQVITCDKDKGIKIEQCPKLPADNGVTAETEDFYAEEITRIMEKAIKKSIEYKHPEYLSVSLSGGVDSSLVAALFKKASDYKIKTNTIACEGWEEDLPYARQVAQHLDTKHEELILSAKEVVETLIKVTGKIDLPTSNLRLFIRKYHDDNPDVFLLGGFGADELFLGWPQYQRMLQPDNYEKNAFLPGIIKQQITRNAEPFLTNHLFAPEEKRLLFTEEAWDKIKNYLSKYPLRQHVEYHTPEEGVKLIQRFHLRHRMADWQLMWAGFGNIYPYLEEEFVNFAVKIPVRYNIKNGAEKYILRKAAQPWLPDIISNRADSHSSLPLARWFEAGLKEKTIPLLNDSYLVEEKIFNRKYIEGLLKTFDNSMLVKIYHIALLEIWFRNHQ